MGVQTPTDRLRLVRSPCLCVSAANTVRMPSSAEHKSIFLPRYSSFCLPSRRKINAERAELALKIKETHYQNRRRAGKARRWRQHGKIREKGPYYFALFEARRTLKGRAVERTLDPQTRFLGYMEINLRGFYTLMAKEILDGSNIRSTLEKVGGERVPQDMGSYSLSYACGQCRAPNDILKGTIQDMMAPFQARDGIGHQFSRGKEPLPCP